MKNKELIAKYKSTACTWNLLKDDVDRWSYLLNHRDQYKLYLDNDSTHVVVRMSKEDEDMLDTKDFDQFECNEFYHYIGWHDGIQLLLQALGIQAEPV